MALARICADTRRLLAEGSIRTDRVADARTAMSLQASAAEERASDY